MSLSPIRIVKFCEIATWDSRHEFVRSAAKEVSANQQIRRTGSFRRGRDGLFFDAG